MLCLAYSLDQIEHEPYQISNKKGEFGMIEFNGYISGAAEKHFRKKSQILLQNALLIGLTVFLPIIIFIAIKIRYVLLLVAYCGMFVIVPLLVRIPQSKKERKACTPKRIMIDGKNIVCVADKYTETKRINDVKQVRDFGEFYEIVFPFGKMSEKFICQKDLLTKGSLAAFEKIFKGRMIKK